MFALLSRRCRTFPAGPRGRAGVSVPVLAAVVLALSPAARSAPLDDARKLLAELHPLPVLAEQPHHNAFLGMLVYIQQPPSNDILFNAQCRQSVP